MNGTKGNCLILGISVAVVSPSQADGTDKEVDKQQSQKGMIVILEVLLFPFSGHLPLLLCFQLSTQSCHTAKLSLLAAQTATVLQDLQGMQQKNHPTFVLFTPTVPCSFSLEDPKSPLLLSAQTILTSSM